MLPSTATEAAALKSYAAEGWRVIEGFVAASLWKSMKAEILVILEREQVADVPRAGNA